MDKNLALVIVGGGGAAVQAIKAIRQRGYQEEVHLFNDSHEPPINPMLLTYYLAGKIPLERCYLVGDDLSFFKQYRVKLHIGSPVVNLNVKEKALVNAKGQEIQYDACLISSGGSAILPRIPGATSKRVFTFRTIEDAKRLREALLTNPQKVLIVGASMVGIKLIEIFNEAGVEVFLADLAPQVFPLSAHADCAALIQEQLLRKGVHLFFNTKVQGIEESDRQGLKVSLVGSRPEVEVDYVVFCIGVKPNLDFIPKDDLIIEKGIVVDQRMQSSHEGVFAAGDVAQAKNLLNQKNEVIPLWANACQQGQIAGTNMAGGQMLYPGSIPQNITHFFDVFFVSIGDTQGKADVIKSNVLISNEVNETLKNRVSYLYVKQGKLMGLNLLSWENHEAINSAGIYRHQIFRTLTNPQKWSNQVDETFLGGLQSNQNRF